MGKINYGNMEEFLHEKRSAIRILDGTDIIFEGVYLDYTQHFAIVTNNNKEVEQPKRDTSFIVWHRTKWATYGMKK